MISRETIQKILETAVHAPSGENSQPWKFVVEGDQIKIFNIPERDESLYNVDQKGSFVAHGALLENILIASSVAGYKASYKLFPDNSDKNLVAIVSFFESSPREEQLYPFITKRSTNRKPYEVKPLSEQQVSELINVSQEIGGGIVKFITDRNKIEQLAEAASANEKVMFSNKYLHNFFFTHINWTENEEREKRVGFYIKALEMPAPAQKAMKLFKHWPIMKVLSKLGLANKIAQENTKGFMASAAIGAVLGDGDTPSDYVATGRLMQRLWLKATKMGLSIQPLTGALFLYKNMAKRESNKFSANQIEILENANTTIKAAFDVQKKTIAMMFRIGHGDAPTARSMKLAPIILNGSEKTEPTKKNPEVLTTRKGIINHILADLKILENNPSFHNKYAIRENIAFFEAIKSVPNYIKWLVQKAGKLDRTKLLELTDFPFPKWDREMHRKLIEMEKKDFPGLVAPLVNRVTELILAKKDRFIGVGLGCGGMEVERQVIKKLLEKNHPHQVVLIGVDKSPVTHEVARENLREVEPHIDIHEIENLNSSSLENLLKGDKHRHIVILCKNDIFKLPEHFPPQFFDVIYHSLFKHHLMGNHKAEMDSVVTSLRKCGLEYDGFKNWPIIIPQTLTGWSHPAFFNAEIFSNFRFLEKHELMKIYSGLKLSFFKRTGTYLLEHRHEG